MKPFTLFIFLFFSVLAVNAQDFQISFSGTGSSTTVETVTVENLTQGKSITLSGSEVLHLLSNITGTNPIINDLDNPLHIYPNPNIGNCTLEIGTKKFGMVTINVYDLIGREITNLKQTLTTGIHSFRLNGIDKGIYIVKATVNGKSYSEKLISQNSSKSIINLNYLGNSGIIQGKSKLKSAKAERSWQYNTGDRLKFQGSSGKYSTIVMDVPTQSKTLSFDFVECTDADGNNYPVVQIGNQLWMAENLKTTKYNDGTSIPNETDNTNWMNLSTGSYCWYNNDINNKATYGALYNWFAVGTDNLAPTGWHVPTNVEWSDFITFMGGEKEAGGKLKEISTKHWASPNSGATNEVGFTGLPCGIRSVDKQNSLLGDFSNVGVFCYWWSLDLTWLNVNDLGYNNPNINKASREKQNGCSVRCIKDIPIPKFVTKTANYKGINMTVGNINNNLNFSGNYYHIDELISSFIFEIKEENMATSRYTMSDHSYVFFDYNNDGYLDLFGWMYNVTPVMGRFNGKYILINNVLGGSKKKITFYESDIAWPSGMEVNDFNNDGIPDVVFYSYNDHTDTGGLSLNSPKPVEVFLFNRDGTFKEVNATIPLTVHDMASGDVNNDGNVDLLVWEYSNLSKPSLYLNDGVGNFTIQNSYLTFSGLEEIIKEDGYYCTTSVELFDLNKDGYLDMITGQNIGQTKTNPWEDYRIPNCRIYWGNSMGTFDLKNNYSDLPNTSIKDFSIANSVLGFSFLDFDKDGDYDVLVSVTPDYGGYYLQLYENLGNKTFSVIFGQSDHPVPI